MGNQMLLMRLNQTEYIATSVICELEYLAFPGLSQEDKWLFDQFRTQIQVVDLCSDDEALKEQILSLRCGKNLKLPDAIIAASAMQKQCILLTADKQLLNHAGVRTESIQFPGGVSGS